MELLKDHDAIENLQAAYGFYFDKSLWRDVADLFAPDGTFEYGQMGVYVGQPHIRRALLLFGREGPEPGKLNNYMQLQGIIHVAPDGRTAKARWRGMVQLGRANQSGQWGEGTYENEYVKQGGVWKIARLHFYVTGFTDYDAGWAKSAIPMQGPSAAIPPDRRRLRSTGPSPASTSRRTTISTRSRASRWISRACRFRPGAPMMRPSRLFAALALAAAVAVPGLAAAADASAAARLDALGKRIGLLEDANQVEIVQRAYGYFVDKAQWTQLSLLFSKDATLEIGGRGVFVGRDRVLEYMQKAFGRTASRKARSSTTCSSSRSSTSIRTGCTPSSACAPSS